ncbi:MAG: hypothetical protein ABI660_07580 [Polaromonas sp.]
MLITLSSRNNLRRSSGPATHPIDPPWRGLGALLVLAGMSLLRSRAYPTHAMTTHSGASNCGF